MPCLSLPYECGSGPRAGIALYAFASSDSFLIFMATRSCNMVAPVQPLLTVQIKARRGRVQQPQLPKKYFLQPERRLKSHIKDEKCNVYLRCSQPS